MGPETKIVAPRKEPLQTRISPASGCKWVFSSVRVGPRDQKGLRPLVRIEDRFTSAAYCSFLDDVMVSYLLNGPFPEGDYIFQQDNSPIHTSGRVTSFSRIVESTL
nr:uncharacterized protein LOC129382906 [Dermacentor andersoni]